MNPPESIDTTGRSRFVEIMYANFATLHAIPKLFSEATVAKKQVDRSTTRGGSNEAGDFPVTLEIDEVSA